MCTWRRIIGHSLKTNSETWDDVIKCTLTEEELDTSFDPGYGLPEGKPFGVWTKEYVYFPCCYDGSEWCGSVPRNPRDMAIEYIGCW